MSPNHPGMLGDTRRVSPNHPGMLGDTRRVSPNYRRASPHVASPIRMSTPEAGHRPQAAVEAEGRGRRCAIGRRPQSRPKAEVVPLCGSLR